MSFVVSMSVLRLFYAKGCEEWERVMPLSHSEEYPCEYENLKLAANSPKMIRLAWRSTKKSEAL